MNFNSVDGKRASVQDVVGEKAIVSQNRRANFERNSHFDMRRTLRANSATTVSQRVRFSFARLAKALSSPGIARFGEEGQTVLAHIKNTTNGMERL